MQISWHSCFDHYNRIAVTWIPSVSALSKEKKNYFVHQRQRVKMCAKSAELFEDFEKWFRQSSQKKLILKKKSKGNQFTKGKPRNKFRTSILNLLY